MPKEIKPAIDLVKMFYDQDIDHKSLEKALNQRENTAKGFTNLSLNPYAGEFSPNQKKHLLNRTMVGYCHRHQKDLENLNLDQSIDLIFLERTHLKNQQTFIIGKKMQKNIENAMKVRMLVLMSLLSKEHTENLDLPLKNNLEMKEL